MKTVLINCSPKKRFCASAYFLFLQRIFVGGEKVNETLRTPADHARILEQLKDIDCYVKISTKSSLIQRDLELLKQFRHLTVDLSINTLDKSSERTWTEDPVFRKDFIR